MRLLPFPIVMLAVGALLAALPAAPGSGQAAATTWEQVNADAFGLGQGDYGNEDAFEVLVFDKQLYLGMEADNSLGARLWRTRRGITTPTALADWEEVAADAQGNPFGSSQRQQNDHIDSLAAFGGQLYASTANRSGTSSGTLVYRLAETPALTWTQVITPGFGDGNNTNFKDMQVFDGHLCGGTQNIISGTQVWCTPDGRTWSQKNRSGFGTPNNQGIWSGGVFRGALYVGVSHQEEQPGAGTRGKLFRTASLSGTVTWEEVYRGPFASAQVIILGELDGYLYIATRTVPGVLVLRSATGDRATWREVSAYGLGGSPANQDVLSDGGTVHQGALYVAVRNAASGCEVWRTRGQQQADGMVDWEQVGSDGLGDANNHYARLVSFHTRLYAWTGNYVSGQQVRRLVVPKPPAVYLPLVQNGSAS